MKNQPKACIIFSEEAKWKIQKLLGWKNNKRRQDYGSNINKNHREDGT